MIAIKASDGLVSCVESDCILNFVKLTVKDVVVVAEGDADELRVVCI